MIMKGQPKNNFSLSDSFQVLSIQQKREPPFIEKIQTTGRENNSKMQRINSRLKCNIIKQF